MDVADARSLMLYFATVLGAMAIYTIKRLRAASAVPAEEKAGFVLMGGGSQAVLQMDPRQADREAAVPGATPSSWSH